MEASASNILQLIILAGLLSIVYGFFTGKNILSSSPGNSKMQEIASAIQVGAKAYLNRQYKTIAIVGVVVLVIISFSFSILVGLGYLIGAALSHILADIIASIMDPHLRELVIGIAVGGTIPLLTIPFLEKWITKSKYHIVVGDHEDIEKDRKDKHK